MAEPGEESGREPESVGSGVRADVETRFGANNNANPNGRRGKPKPEEDDGLGQDEGRRMRRVYHQPPSADCNSAQRVLRKTLDKNPTAYVKLMTDLERQAATGATAGGPEPKSLPPDEGEARVRRLKMELLDRANAGYRAWKEWQQNGSPRASALNEALERQKQLEEAVADLKEKVRVLGGNPDCRIGSAEFFNGATEAGRG